MRVNSDHGNQSVTTAPRRSVYDGQERIGDVQEQADGFLARGRQGHVIGVFQTLPAAATECWRAAHGQTRGES
jgi:hypothetical protein